MTVEYNWLAVILATLSTMVVGSVWYAKAVFGRTWMKLVGLKDNETSKGAGKAIFITLVVSFVTAYVLAHITYIVNQFYGNSFLEDALSTAFWAWLGFTAARMITHDVFARRSKDLIALNVAHEFVTFMVMGLIIGLFGI